ncbi:MAG: hypothetical protein OXU36_11320 [Candidatus Poribacteria bacterium]|nr:hypothetical protein [Candidatus Poribacteria bacterium]
MTQTAIHRNLFTSKQIRTDNLGTGPKDFWIPEQPTTQKERKNLITKISLIDTLENEDLAREKQVSETLNEIREEVKEICAVTNDVTPVPESAYVETHSFLSQMPSNIPVPDIMWLESGGIGLEWRPGDSIVTMSLYGDNHVNLVAILGKQYEIAVTCPLSDQLVLPNFLETLSILFQQRT